MCCIDIKTNPLEEYSGTKGTLQGFIFVLFFLLFFFNQRQLDARDLEAFTKVTFSEKLYNQ